jgi:hypothetical protein
MRLENRTATPRLSRLVGAILLLCLCAGCSSPPIIDLARRSMPQISSNARVRGEVLSRDIAFVYFVEPTKADAGSYWISWVHREKDRGEWQVSGGSSGSYRLEPGQQVIYELSGTGIPEKRQILYGYTFDKQARLAAGVFESGKEQRDRLEEGIFMLLHDVGDHICTLVILNDKNEQIANVDMGMCR